MLSVLASGNLVRDPQRRKSAAGKDFVTALMRVPAEESESILASLIAFSKPAVEALLKLKQGDALAVSGRGSLRSWDSNGETKHGVSVVVDVVMTVYQAGARRKQAQEVGEAA